MNKLKELFYRRSIFYVSAFTYDFVNNKRPRVKRVRFTVRITFFFPSRFRIVSRFPARARHFDGNDTCLRTDVRSDSYGPIYAPAARDTS